MTLQIYLLLIFTFNQTNILQGLVETSIIQQMNQEVDSTVSFQCEIDQLPFNAVITWVYRPKIPKSNGIKWLPLYANGRRLTQNNERFIVDFNGYNEKTKKYLSILTIHQIQSSDEGLYMCKSNQYQSTPYLFNLTISPLLRIFPKDGLIEVDRHHRSLNLSCTVREYSMNTIDPLQLKWYHNNHEIAHRHLKKKYSPHQNQATLILYIRNLVSNDSDLFKCIYDNGKASKDVRIVYTSSSMIGYSKSIGRRIMSSCLSLFLISFILL